MAAERRGPLQLPPQVAVVVDLAVVDHRDRSVLVGHRLVAGGREIDDGEAAVSEHHGAVLVQASAVGPAEDLRHQHTPHEAGLREGVGRHQGARDATHQPELPASGWR